MTEFVTSLQNPTVKLAVSLQHKKRREETGLFVVEGVRQAEEILASNWEIDFGLFTESAAKQERAAKVIAAASRRCRMIGVSDSVFVKASETEQPQGVLLVARQAALPLDHLFELRQPLIVVIDGVQDPGNMGTLLRTADAAGADGVVVTRGSADPYSGKALRASMGSAFHLPLTVGVQHAELIARFKQVGIRVVATALDQAESYLQADYQGPLAIIFGNEGQGVSQELLSVAEKKLCIPIYGLAESLNVAVAAAVVLYEAARQRRTGI